jgi:hypothetical protein
MQGFPSFNRIRSENAIEKGSLWNEEIVGQYFDDGDFNRRRHNRFSGRRAAEWDVVCKDSAGQLGLSKSGLPKLWGNGSPRWDLFLPAF